MAQVIRYLLLLNHPEISDFFWEGGGIKTFESADYDSPLFLFILFVIRSIHPHDCCKIKTTSNSTKRTSC